MEEIKELTKPEKIVLLLKQGKTMRQILEVVDTKESYVKSICTKSGLEVAKEESVQDEAPTLATLPKKVSIVAEMSDYLKDLPIVRRAILNSFCAEVRDIIAEDDFSPMRHIRMNARFARISPRPTQINLYKDVYKTFIRMNELFKVK